MCTHKHAHTQIVASFFLLELVLKVWGWGPTGYVWGSGHVTGSGGERVKTEHVRWTNIFDFIITAISTAEMPSMIASVYGCVCVCVRARVRVCVCVVL